MSDNEFADLVLEAFRILGPDHPNAILADAALHYNSTQAHRARARAAALEALIPHLDAAR